MKKCFMLMDGDLNAFSICSQEMGIGSIHYRVGHFIIIFPNSNLENIKICLEWPHFHSDLN